MKKYISIAILIAVLFTTTGCSETEFQKKKDCANYATYTQEYIVKPMILKGSNYGYLKEIFYSPSLNTCIAVINYDMFFEDRISTVIYLYDVLESSFVYEFDSYSDDYYEKSQEMIYELKN